MTTGPEPSDARLASDCQPESTQSRALAAYLLIAESAEADANSRMSAAQRLIPLDQQAAARAFHAIAVSGGMDSRFRMSAARQIEPLDAALAVQALDAIAADPHVSFTERVTAASTMVRLESSRVSAILRKLSAESLQSPPKRLAREEINTFLVAVDNLAKFDPGAAVEIFYELAGAPIDGSYRLAAADRIARLERNDPR